MAYTSLAKPILTATATATTTSSGSIPLDVFGVSNTAHVILAARVTSRVGFAFHRGDAYIMVFDSDMNHLASQSVTVELAYARR